MIDNKRQKGKRHDFFEKKSPRNWRVFRHRRSLLAPGEKVSHYRRSCYRYFSRYADYFSME